MEIAGEDGSRIQINPNSATVLGRGSGFSTADRTVSRRHVLFSLKESEAESGTRTEPRVCFEVIGKNPIWVRSREGGEVRVFRSREKGDVAAGDWLCVGGRSPLWFALKKIESEEESEIVESSGELENFEVSSIDPVKEFGFLVIGHEFDRYPKQRIRDIRNWDWFLEEPRKDTDDDDEDSGKRRKGGSGKRRKRGKGEDNDDGDWTGGSEEDNELIAKVRKVQRPKYSTRSKNRDMPDKGTKHGSVQKDAVLATREESEDEEDPTLGGFIVDDEDEEVEEESDADEEEADEDFNEGND